MSLVSPVATSLRYLALKKEIAWFPVLPLVSDATFTQDCRAVQTWLSAPCRPCTGLASCHDPVGKRGIQHQTVWWLIFRGCIDRWDEPNGISHVQRGSGPACTCNQTVAQACAKSCCLGDLLSRAGFSLQIFYRIDQKQTNKKQDNFNQVKYT